MSEVSDDTQPKASAQTNGRRVDDWLREYSRFHQNHTNKLIHWVCVPLIMFSLLALLWIIPLPAAITERSEWLNPATLLFVIALLFYARLSIPLMLGMLLIAGAGLWGISLLNRHFPALVGQLSVAVFAVAWVGQFIGHKIEGRKPAFFQDIQFLLIGPVWLLGFVYKRLGIRY